MPMSDEQWEEAGRRVIERRQRALEKLEPYDSLDPAATTGGDVAETATALGAAMLEFPDAAAGKTS